MNEVKPISINPESIDSKVLEVIRNNPGIVKECVYYLLPHHDKALVYSSLKRLEKSELLGYTIAHSPTKENSTDESAEENHSPSYRLPETLINSHERSTANIDKPRGDR